ncbi:MAG: glycosyltransferase [Planctomycetales bacterium]
MISFIVPAHNEELLLGRTLAAIQEVGESIGEPWEVIVVDDASTDGTSTIAAKQGARVISVRHRQIAATRNSGGCAAGGEILFFVDADTLPTREAVAACLRELRAGAVGGGCMFEFDCPLPWWARIVHPLATAAGRWLKLVGGCFLYCTREAFAASGGFDEQYFAGEELDFMRRLKRLGRVVVPRATVITSGRKLSQLRAWSMLTILVQATLFGLKPFRQREGLDLWYKQRESSVPLPETDSKDGSHSQ